MTASQSGGGVARSRTGVAIRGGAVRVIGFAVGLLVSLGSATILVRHLGVSSFGRYVTVTSLVGIVGGVTEAGINVYGIREWSQRTDSDRRALFANLLTIRLLLSAVGIGCVVCFGLAVGYRQVIVLGTVVGGAGLLIQVVADVLSISLQASLQLGRMTLVELTRRVSALILIGLLALLDATLLPFIAASTVAGLLALALMVRLVRGSMSLRLGFMWDMWRELISETLPYAVALSIATVYFYVTVIVMSLIASAHEAGLFATSFRVVQVALVIPGLLLTAVFPLMTRPETDEVQRGEIVGKVFAVALVCGAWMSLVVALGAPALIDVIGGHKAQGAVPVLRIQALVLVFSFISTANAFNLVAIRRYRPLMATSASVLAVNIGLAFALVPALGAEGGALGDVIAEFALAIATTLVVIRAVPRHKITGAIGPPVIIASALSTSVLLLPVGSAVEALVASVVYFCVLVVARAVPDEVLNAVRQVRALYPPP